MIHIKEAIVVEGKFDKEQLKKVTDAFVICTGGFTIYTDKSIMNSIRHLAKTVGVIVLTDSDSAGFRIRNYIKRCVGKDGVVKHAYVPTIKGKERRKSVPGKEGILGVEGISEEELDKILKSVTQVEESALNSGTQITKAMLYEDGLCGRENSCELRKRLARSLKLPLKISANALLEFLNMAVGYDAYKACLERIKDDVIG